MQYVRTNFVPDSLNNLPEEEDNKISITDEEYALHEERENLKKIVKQDGQKHLKKVENIPFTDSRHDNWLQKRVCYFATRSSNSKVWFMVCYITITKPSGEYPLKELERFKSL